MKHENLLPHIKMEKKNFMFCNFEIEKIKLCAIKVAFLKKDVDIEKVVVSKKIYLGDKYFIGYLYSDFKNMPLHIMLPKTSTHVKRHDGKTKWMCF